MKRLLIILLALAMLAALPACGKKAQEPAPLPVESAAPAETPAPTDDPNTVHVERTPAPEISFAPEAQATPAPTASPVTPEPVGTPSVTTPEPAAAPTPPPVPEVSISAGSAVYSIVDHSGSYTDALGNTCSYEFRVPAFGCTGPDTELLSEELYNAVMPTVNSQLAAMQAGNSLTVTRTEYESYSNGRYISVLCTVYHAEGGCSYKAVTLNADSGYRASASELMQYVGVSEADFAILASQAVGTKFTELYGQPADDASAAAYNSSIDPAGLAGAELFINSAGRLAFEARVYAPDGSSANYIIAI